MTTRTVTLAVALGALLLAVAAVASGCGSSSSSEDGVAALDDAPTTTGEEQGSSGAAEEDPEEAALDWARCMRERGIDVPDPEVDGDGRIQIRPGAGRRLGDVDSDAFREAQEACGTPFGDNGGPPALSEDEREEMQETFLEYAACMRKNGIDMPDPDFSRGGVGLVFGSEDVDPESESFRDAQEICGELLEDALPGRRSDDGGDPQ